MLGRDDADPLATQWLIRVFLALWCWPLKDRDTERTLVQRFLGATGVAPSDSWSLGESNP